MRIIHLKKPEIINLNIGSKKLLVLKIAANVRGKPGLGIHTPKLSSENKSVK
jgi:hypothetical protein